MTIRKVTAYQAENGTLHTSERAALMASVAHHLGLDAGDEVEASVAQLLGIVPLLQRLGDPSIMAQGPKAQEPAPAPAPAREPHPTTDIDQVGRGPHVFHGQPVDGQAEEFMAPPEPPFPVTDRERSGQEPVPGFEHPTLGRIEVGDEVAFGVPSALDGAPDLPMAGHVEAMPNEQGWMRVKPNRADELDDPAPQVIKPDAITRIIVSRVELPDG